MSADGFNWNGVTGRLQSVNRSLIKATNHVNFNHYSRVFFWRTGSLAQLNDSWLQRRARQLCQQLDLLQQLRRRARQDLILECRKHSETKLLRSIPWLGPIRMATLIGRVQKPHRFRTNRQLSAYCGLALETRSSADYRMVNGQLERRKKPLFGMDKDTPGVAERTLQQVRTWPPGLPIFGRLTSLPATPLYKRLEAAGRLTRPRHWLDLIPFTMAHTPLKMTKRRMPK